ncbi:DNA-binding helix-turn-helix domain protein [Peptoanaerobacter stomatis]|uniref:DNA-binding helix-turn-helix domain protein n=1 Tax=Peptoanaerobacter stomatis TaxID=796937 RepID=J4W0B0_9FIRM|nr:DUF6471 domain-containing protein [Peptoanaerobacter stomatis]EJU19781.1 DNA-binding helix-turn-helix domain protein [Peptoanaerobacter stomatis]
MNAGNIIKKLLIDKKLTQAELAKKINSSPQNLTNKLNRGDFRVSEFAEMLDILGYEIKIEKKC